MLEQIPIEFESYVLSIFNEIFSKGVFPHFWKSSLVMLISKPGLKWSFRLCHTYVSWSVSYRLNWYVEFRPILSQSQSDFRPFKACDNNLATLVTSVKTGFLN